jgi:hypothetical protein
MTQNTNGVTGDSTGSLVKKGALATTAVALGAGAMATSVAAQENGRVVVFGTDYIPDVDFDIVSQADTGARNDVFRAADLVDEFSDPDDWDLYVITYDTGGSVPSLGYLLSDDTDLSDGDSGTFEEEASIRNSELNLIEFDL